VIFYGSGAILVMQHSTLSKSSNSNKARKMGLFWNLDGKGDQALHCKGREIEDEERKEEKCLLFERKDKSLKLLMPTP